MEHPVTEVVTGVDLIAEQPRVAAGSRCGYAGGTWCRAARRSSAGSTWRILDQVLADQEFADGKHDTSLVARLTER